MEKLRSRDQVTMRKKVLRGARIDGRIIESRIGKEMIVAVQVDGRIVDLITGSRTTRIGGIEEVGDRQGTISMMDGLMLTMDMTLVEMGEIRNSHRKRESIYSICIGIDKEFVVLVWRLAFKDQAYWAVCHYIPPT